MSHEIGPNTLVFPSDSKTFMEYPTTTITDAVMTKREARPPMSSPSSSVASSSLSSSHTTARGSRMAVAGVVPPFANPSAHNESLRRLLNSELPQSRPSLSQAPLQHLPSKAYISNATTSSYQKTSPKVVVQNMRTYRDEDPTTSQSSYHVSATPSSCKPKLAPPAIEVTGVIDSLGHNTHPSGGNGGVEELQQSYVFLSSRPTPIPVPQVPRRDGRIRNMSSVSSSSSSSNTSSNGSKSSGSSRASSVYVPAGGRSGSVNGGMEEEWEVVYPDD